MLMGKFDCKYLGGFKQIRCVFVFLFWRMASTNSCEGRNEIFLKNEILQRSGIKPISELPIFKSTKSLKMIA